MLLSGGVSKKRLPAVPLQLHDLGKRQNYGDKEKYQWLLEFREREQTE